MRNNKTVTFTWGEWDVVPQVKEEWDLMVADKLNLLIESGKTDGKVVTETKADNQTIEVRHFADSDTAETWAGEISLLAFEMNKPLVSFRLSE